MKKLVVVVTGNANGDRSTIGLTVASAALSKGMEVAVFLTSDGVELTRDGACDSTHIRPFRPLADLVEEFTSNGGVLLACGSCFQFRGMDQAANAPGVEVGGVGTLVSWLAEGAQTITF